MTPGARLVLTSLLAAGIACGPASAAPIKRIGTVDLHACGRCSCILRRLQASVRSRRCGIGIDYHSFRVLSALGNGQIRGTLVATEGGPGYPATGSREDYLALFKPLMPDHDLLMMDNRGTGQSGHHRLP